MSDDSFTEVSTQGWFSRIGGAIKGLFIGLLLFLVAFPLLFWNEGRAVNRAKTLEEGAGIVVTINADSVNAANDLKLVHASAIATTEETLSDQDFQVSRNALQLRRNVEMYQWQERSETHTEKQLGGSEKTTTKYTYTKSWSSFPIDSSEFKRPEGHQNPDSMRYSSTSLQAQQVSFGAFSLPASMARRIDSFTKVNIDATAPIPAGISGAATHYDGGYYIGESPSSPSVGDLRISFEEVKPVTVSIVAQQTGNSFQAYQTSNGGNISLLKIGQLDANAMFQQAQSENTMLTWILRVVGFFLMTFGLRMFVKPLSVLADVVPFIGNLVEFGTGIISFLIALTLTLLTVAVAWIYYRPLLAAIIIGVAIALLWLSRMRVKRVRQQKMPQQLARSR